MQSGKLDQQVILKSLSETNVSGEVTPAYTTVATVWAHVITQHGQEALEAARTNARATVRVLLRYRSDVTTKWRFVWGGETYNVKAVDRSMRRNGELWITGEVVGAL